jgi:hypothetical protein
MNNIIPEDFAEGPITDGTRAVSKLSDKFRERLRVDRRTLLRCGERRYDTSVARACAPRWNLLLALIDAARDAQP